MSGLAGTRIVRLFEEIRALNVEMQAQTMQVFAVVATYPGLNLREIELKTGIAGSSVSRNVAALSKTHRKGMEGLDLVVALPDPMDGRTKRIHLTPKGKAVWERMLQLVGEGS